VEIAKGVATKIGVVGSTAGVLIPFVGELADTTKPLGVPSTTWVYLGAVLAMLTVVGRMAQACVALWRGAPRA
jgi:hypothetical protein